MLQKCTTTAAVPGIVGGMDGYLEQRYVALVERVRGYPLPAPAKAVILAKIEAIHRRETAARDTPDLP